MESVPCNLCGSTDLSFVYRRPDGVYFPDEWFDVVACRFCGLGFVNPRPTMEEMPRFYRGDYYDPLADEDHTHRYELQRAYLRSVRPIVGPPRLLDVGCGMGDFPRHMSNHGWAVEGVEVYCKIPIEDFPVHRQPFDKLAGMEEKFDAVTAWAVLEHVHDPMAYFLKAGQVLKQGGLFVFLVTNFESLSSKRLFQEDVPRHTYFYTRRTVERFLDHAGMELVSSDHGEGISAIGARGAVAYLFTRFIKGRPYKWRDRPLGYREYLANEGLSDGPVALLRFAMSHPVAFLDRLVEPLVIRGQKLMGSYGIATYVARKR